MPYEVTIGNFVWHILCHKDNNKKQSVYIGLANDTTTMYHLVFINIYNVYEYFITPTKAEDIKKKKNGLTLLT